uniref:Uncharacterized protein n=1 Tax=Panagrolaimus sp. PS1159 TaxID=55785 RepID=A0AC35F4X6_9BILA
MSVAQNVTSQILSLIDPNVNLEEKVKTLTKPLDQNIGMMLLIENTMDPQIQDWEYLPNVGQTVLDQFAIFLSDHYLELTQQCSTRNKIQNEETLCYLINNFDLPLFGIQKPINSLKEIPYAILFNILFTTIVQLHVHPSAIKLAKEFMEKKNLSTFDPKALKNDILKEFASLSL